MGEFVFGFLAGAIVVAIMAVFLFRYILKQGQVGLSESLEKGSGQLVQMNNQNLGQVLDPLRERISEYQKLVEETYSKESRERFALQKEVEKLILANEKIGQEASSLTRALKGDVKLQGSWGEMILENLLENSGLVEGREYTLQGKGMGLKDADGNSYKPDVLINLPNHSHVIVDSKVSLTHFIEFLQEEDVLKREELVKSMKKSIQSHVDGLASKSYQNLEGVQTPDFVFMFIPIEAAYTVTLQSFPEILDYCWKKNVVIVTPSTLMASLRTIASIWRIEKQSENAQEIAKKGGQLYDKLVLFYDDLQKIGDSLDRTRKAYDGAVNKLQTGKGNLIGRAEELKELGAKSTKSFQ
jgi:DNA recombination protein RmuC